MKRASRSLAVHKKLKGKIEIAAKAKIRSRKDLSLLYTPGVGDVASYLARYPEKARDYTIKRNTVAVVSDGSAVLGLGNVGPMAALPVMEGKAALFKELGGINAFPIVLATQDPEEIVAAVTAIAPAFGGINLEDISAPRCFVVERRLKELLEIPVFHDDQHGAAIVILAGLLNALKVAGKSLAGARIVIVGAGAAGNASAHLLTRAGAGNLLVVDSVGIIFRGQRGLDVFKTELAKLTNPRREQGNMDDAIRGADALIGVATRGLFQARHIRSMAPRPVVFALSNPVPEIDPVLAKRAGAFIVATGRSDHPNQINNALVFPGIFRGALDKGVRRITEKMQLAAAKNLAGLVRRPAREKIIPSVFDRRVVSAVASAVKRE